MSIKDSIKFFTVLILIIFLMMTPLVFPQDKSTPVEQPSNQVVVIHDQKPLLMVLIREGELTNVSYNVYGLMESCDFIFGVKNLVFANESDSSYVPFTMVSHSMSTEDSCVVENFKFNVHGGALRHLIEKPGDTYIYLIGEINQGVLIIPEENEQMVIDMIFKTKGTH